MVRDYLPTSFILAKYAEKKKGSDEYKSIYKPTHIMKAKINEDDEAHDDEDVYGRHHDGDGDCDAHDDGEEDHNFDEANKQQQRMVLMMMMMMMTSATNQN